MLGHYAPTSSEVRLNPFGHGFRRCRTATFIAANEVSRHRGSMEHRWGHRHEISRPVHLGTGSGIAARGRICNVSISGAFVVAPLPVSLFSYVEVQFTAMLNGKRTFTCVEGQVVRKDATGFGVEWCEFAPEAVRALVAVPAFRDDPAPFTLPTRDRYYLA